MKKLLFCPLWNLHKLEKRLHEFELAGWRLQSVKYSCFYYFSKSVPKDAEYIVIYSMANDNNLKMHEYRQQLLSEYSANEISTVHTKYNIFRITGENRNFNELFEYRTGYFKHVYFQYFMTAFVLFAVLLITVILAMKNSGIISFKSILLLVCLIVCFGFAAYFLYGYIKQRK